MIYIFCKKASVFAKLCVLLYGKKSRTRKRRDVFEKETNICMLRSYVNDGPYDNRRIPNKSK